MIISLPFRLSLHTRTHILHFRLLWLIWILISLHYLNTLLVPRSLPVCLMLILNFRRHHKLSKKPVKPTQILLVHFFPYLDLFQSKEQLFLLSSSRWVISYSPRTLRIARSYFSTIGLVKAQKVFTKHQWEVLYFMWSLTWSRSRISSLICSKILLRSDCATPNPFLNE